MRNEIVVYDHSITLNYYLKLNEGLFDILIKDHSKNKLAVSLYETLKENNIELHRTNCICEEAESDFGLPEPVIGIIHPASNKDKNKENCWGIIYEMSLSKLKTKFYVISEPESKLQEKMKFSSNNIEYLTKNNIPTVLGLAIMNNFQKKENIFKIIKESNFADEALDGYNLRRIMKSSANHLAWMKGINELEIIAYDCEKSGKDNLINSIKFYKISENKIKGYSIMLGKSPKEGRLNLDAVKPKLTGKKVLDYLIK